MSKKDEKVCNNCKYFGEGGKCALAKEKNMQLLRRKTESCQYFVKKIEDKTK